MVAYLEKTDGNTEFHQIMDFLTRSSIYYALTVSPIVSTLFIEQFWITAKSRTVNNISYIDATVAGKPVTILEASIRSDLLFDDADGIDSLNNQAIFDNIQLMGFLVGIMEVTNQAKEIKHLKAQIKKLKKKAKPVITHHKAWMKSVSMKQILARKKSLKQKWMQKEYVSKQGRKPAKAEPTVYKDPAFDDLDDIVDDAMDYMESEDAQDEGRTSSVVLEEKESADKEVSTEAPVSTVKPNKGTDKRNKGTNKQDGGTDSTKVSTDRQGEGTADQNEGKSVTQTASTTTSTHIPTIFGDDETIAQVLITMSQNKQKEKEKGVEIRNVEDTERPRPTSTRSVLTLKPLPKIDLKDKDKNMIEEEDESDTESEDITEAEKKFKQLANDEEVARKVQEERFLAQQRSEAIRNKPPSRNQLRNQMMTYLKHVGGKKHSNLKTKSFEEIQVLYENIKRSDDSFIAIGSAEDEKVIKEMNKQAVDASKKRVKKDDSVKGEIKEEEGTRKRKLGKRKKMKSKKIKFTSKDDEELRLCLTIAPDEDKEVDYEILDKKYPIIEWRSEYLTTKPQYDETEELKDVYLNVVIRSNRQRRYFSTLMAVLSILDRDDICAIYQLVINRYQDETPEGFDKILWGDLMIIFNQRVHTIMTDEGLVIHMLVENKYPLKKEVLSKLLELKLETEEDSTMALELIRFVKKQIAELEPKDSDGDEEDP
ncbi:hypothetical protein Tco_0708029 [Tanacetum coccineum]